MLLLTVLSAAVGALALGGASWKWQLPARKSAAIILLSTVAAISAIQAWPFLARQWTHLFMVLVIQGSTFAAVILWLFYRDPNRRPPDEPGIVVSPADGTVIYVRRLEAGEPLKSAKNGAEMVLDELRGTGIEDQPLWQIGIAMVFTDVHVNRSPIPGTVKLLHHRPGAFLSLRKKEALAANERQTLVIGDGSVKVALVQIASRLVRQIVSYVAFGEAVAIGQRIGMIRFGSQVDLFVPVSVAPRLNVVVGQRTRAGETIVCRTQQRG